MDIDAVLLIGAEEIARQLERIRNRHGKHPLVTSERDAAFIDLHSDLVAVRNRARQKIKPKRRKGACGCRHYKRVRKNLKKRVYTFYWSHQEVRRFHGWKCLQSPEHVFLTLEEWTVIREAALAAKKSSWALKKRDYDRCWTWDNVYVLIDKYLAIDPRVELDRPESCPRPDLRFVGKKRSQPTSTSKRQPKRRYIP